MHRRTQELLGHLDRSRRVLLDALATIPADRRDARPAAGGWSAANVLSHLARTEGQVAAFLQRALRTALADDALPPAADESSVLASIDEDRLLDRTTRLVAPDFAAPDPEMPADRALAELERARERARQVLLAGDGRDTSSLRRAHHVLGELTFEQWLAFVGLHMQRHAAQLVELGERLAADDRA